MSDSFCCQLNPLASVLCVFVCGLLVIVLCGFIILCCITLCVVVFCCNQMLSACNTYLVSILIDAWYVTKIIIIIDIVCGTLYISISFDLTIVGKDNGGLRTSSKQIRRMLIVKKIW